MANGQIVDNEEFFRYTSGRWLWDEQARLQERYKIFNVSALQKIAAASVGARHCVSMVKLAEGGFNKLFRLVMNDGAVVIARIPNPSAGSLARTIASEVATKDFVSTILGIPIPKVLAWSVTTENPARTEYILMEEAVGIPLSSKWDLSDVDEKSAIVDELVSIAKKLLSVSFSRYGNIYFSDSAFPGCERLIVHGALPPELKLEVRRRYSIGPVVEKSFYDGKRKDFTGVHGPWSTPQEYIKAIANREIAWLSKHADSTKESHRLFQSKVQRSPGAHIALYRKLLKAADDLLPTDQELVRPTLWHWDLHAPNIFVRDNKITSLIDWQDCWAGPLLLQGWRPRLVEYRGEPMFRLPPHYESLQEGEEKRKIRSNVEKSLLLFSYESQMQLEDPALARIFQLPEAQTIRDTVVFAANTWDGSLLPFRECLLRIQRHWSELHPGELCPFAFSEDELSAHANEGEDWNQNANFWSSVSEVVDRDGFVTNEDYEEVLDMFRQLRDDGLRSLDGDERADFDRATKWAAK